MTEDSIHVDQLQPVAVPTLVVSGSIHYDVLVQLPHLPGDNDRLAPLATTLAPGGMGGNVAAAFARLGGRSRFAGFLTADADGQALRADLIRDGVDTRWALVRQEGGHRGFILVGEEGARAIIGSWPQMAGLERAPGQFPGDVQYADEHRWNPARSRPPGDSWIDPDIFFDSPDGISCPFNFAPLILPAVPESCPVFMDLETGHIEGWEQEQVWAALRRATVIYGNQRNLAHLVEMLGCGSLSILSRNLPTVLIETTGAAGCVIHDRGTSTPVTGFPIEAVDTTGAGDCFAAACTLALLRGHGLAESARFANVAAALSTRHLSSRAGVPTVAEISRLLDGDVMAGTRRPVEFLMHR